MTRRRQRQPIGDHGAVTPARLRMQRVTASVDGHPIVAGADLDAAPGSLIGVVGENGSGKSTVLRAVAGLSRPTTGRVLVDDADLHTLDRRSRARLLAWVGQEDAPADELLVWQAVALGLVPHQSPWAGNRRDEQTAVLAALRDVDMIDFADRRCEHLSGGERRRVMLARGLIQHTGLIVLDEPTNHLDIAHQLALLQLLRRSGRTVLASMHDLDLVRSFFDLAVVLPRNRRRLDPPVVGRPADVLEPGTIKAAFGVDVTVLTDPVTGGTHLALDPGEPRPDPGGAVATEADRAAHR